MSLTVKDLIDKLTKCNPDSLVLITTDWSNENFDKLTEVAPDCLYNPNADEFETKVYNFAEIDEEELEELNEEPKALSYLNCVVLC